MLIICLLLTAFSPGAFALEPPDIDSSRSILVGEASSGKLLFSENAYTRSEPASLTKIMTLLLAVEAIERGEVSLDDTVTASDNCSFDLTADGSTSHIYAGETMSLEDLLYCTALASANEACNIIAEHVCGSVEKFVQRMNGRAAELDCSGTSFKNTHGLPVAGHCATARDLFLIAREAMSHELFAKLVGTAEHTVGATNLSPQRKLSNSNALVCRSSVYGDDYYYEGATGVKTGHTEAAGFCLVSSAERNGIKVIAVILGAAKDAENADGIDSFEDTISLLDWVFDNFSYRTLVTTQDIVGTQPVLDGQRQGKLDLCPASEITALVPNDITVSQLKKQITLYSDSVANVAPGTELGEMTLTDPDGTVYGTVKLTAAGKVRYGEGSTQLTAQQSPAKDKDAQRNAIIMVAAILALFAAVTVLALVRRSEAKKRRKVRR